MSHLNDITWPFQDQSRTIDVHGGTLSFQRFGTGGKVLFIHGTGASGHSWGPLLECIAGQMDVLVVDLPGHRFSPRPARGKSSLRHIALGIEALCIAQQFTPDVIVGHSAGAVIAVELSAQLEHGEVLAINGAFGAFPGPFHGLFSFAAQVMASTRLPSTLLARMGQDRTRVERLLRNTGSRLSFTQVDFYHRLFQDPEHVSGVLQFMADWQITPFLQKLPYVRRPVHFLSSRGDRTVSPSLSASWANTLKHGSLTELPRYGHLVQEEAPSEVFQVLAQMVHQ